MEKSEKIKGMLTLLELNDDQFCYEMTSLATKIDNFLDDRSRLLSGQWLSVMYKSLTEENDSEVIEIITIKPEEISPYEILGEDADDSVETDINDILDVTSPFVDDNRFALV